MSVMEGTVNTKTNKVREPKFYEMDGALRAYSNRSILLAGVMSLVALVAVVGFLFRAHAAPDVNSREQGWGSAACYTPWYASRYPAGGARVGQE